jgi:hypothetical protein
LSHMLDYMEYLILKPSTGLRLRLGLGLLRTPVIG